MTNIVLQANSLYAGAKNKLLKNKFEFSNIEINNVLSVSINQTKAVTKVPLELGAAINDHMYLLPASVTVEISESKFKNLLDEVGKIARVFPTLSDLNVAKDLLSFEGSFYEESTATLKYQELIRVLQSVEDNQNATYKGMFDIDTPNARFTNMTLTGINSRNDTNSHGGFVAVLIFDQLNIIDPSTQLPGLGSIINGGLKKKIEFIGSLF